MIAEAFKVVQSIYPFIKEAFLWRDGAEVGKPITNQNLIRRKIAVFVMLFSLGANYLAIDRLYMFYKDRISDRENIKRLQEQVEHVSKENIELIAKNKSCVSPPELAGILQRYIDDEVAAGRIRRLRKKSS